MSFLGNQSRENELIQALAQNMAPSLEKSASIEDRETEPTNALASVVNTLVKCADRLDEVGHPAADKVDEVLAFIDQELSKEATNK